MAVSLWECGDPLMARGPPISLTSSWCPTRFTSPWQLLPRLLLPSVVTEPPSLVASLALLAHAAGIHENLRASLAHRGKATLPRGLQFGIAEEARGWMQATRRFGAELAADHEERVFRNDRPAPWAYDTNPP
jgi:hypothetical protein